MIKIYGMPTCPYCDYVHEQIKGREDEFEYINIGENIRNMSAFTRLRDTSPVLCSMRFCWRSECLLSGWVFFTLFSTKSLIGVINSEIH